MKMEKKHEDKSLDMASLRAEIDECDRQIVKLLARRYGLVRKVGEYKAIHNLPILDEAREIELLTDRRRLAEAGLNYNIEDIFRLILEQSRQIQVKVKEDRGRLVKNGESRGDDPSGGSSGGVPQPRKSPKNGGFRGLKKR